ncbi:MAG: discoidin domain-containing protein [Verrucomicrobia bacterium]|nr:discoidin domain-containing protein [Verrucomicrobiota bacterium]
MKSVLTLLLSALALTGGARADDLVPLITELPKPMIIGTPVAIKVDNLETAPAPDAPFMVPKTAKNLALNRPVTSSDPAPLLGDYDLITDGDKDSAEGSYVEMAKGTQWVQIDLGQTAELNAVYLWHYHSQQRVYLGVVVQISDDPDFISGVTVIYNNDAKNLSGRGAGKDKSYIETNRGRLLDAKGAKGRYVRLYSNGNSANSANHYIEVEVWGTPVK